MPLKYIPEGMLVQNIDLKPGKGAQIARSAGAYARIMANESGLITLKLPSNEMRMVYWIHYYTSNFRAFT